MIAPPLSFRLSVLPKIAAVAVCHSVTSRMSENRNDVKITNREIEAASCTPMGGVVVGRRLIQFFA